MESLKHVLVCIEEPEQAEWMLNYTGVISRIAGAIAIHLLHVQPDDTDVVPETEQPRQITLDTLRDLANKHLTGHGGEQVTCHVLAGSPLIEILRYALDKNIDLIVLGRQPRNPDEPPHEATLARRITAKSTCAVIVLPKGARPEAQHILVPVRDSECSANAMKAACKIASATGGTVCALNVFAVRSGYLKVGVTLEEHTALMHKWAERECNHLLTRVDTCKVKLKTLCVPDLYAHPVPIILKQIQQMSADLVVIGARGRTGAAGVLLGAVTEQLMRQSPVPMLAVKKKGECLGILRALLTLTS